MEAEYVYGINGLAWSGGGLGPLSDHCGGVTTQNLGSYLTQSLRTRPNHGWFFPLILYLF